MDKVPVLPFFFNRTLNATNPKSPECFYWNNVHRFFLYKSKYYSAKIDFRNWYLEQLTSVNSIYHLYYNTYTILEISLEKNKYNNP